MESKNKRRKEQRKEEHAQARAQKDAKWPYVMWCFDNTTREERGIASTWHTWHYVEALDAIEKKITERSEQTAAIRTGIHTFPVTRASTGISKKYSIKCSEEINQITNELRKADAFLETMIRQLKYVPSDDSSTLMLRLTSDRSLIDNQMASIREIEELLKTSDRRRELVTIALNTPYRIHRRKGVLSADRLLTDDLFIITAPRHGGIRMKD
jgi:hypothetical protein